MTSQPRVLCAGLATLDLVQRVEEFPGPNEKVTALDADLLAGGPATGAALTAAALGARTTLVTALGSHPLAEVVRSELTGYGVEIIDTDPHKAGTPPVSAVSVRASTGERNVVSRNAGGGDIASDFLPDAAEADVVLLDGHHPELATRVAASAQQRRIPILLDAGSWKPVLGELLPLVDVAVCSADFRAPATTCLLDQGPALLDHGVRAVAVTRGPEPVLWWRAGQNRVAGEVSVPQATAVDTLGAGDVFHGALARAMASMPWFEDFPGALGVAARVSASRVEHTGRRSWLTDLQQSKDSAPFE
ncbi:PfkB family carbohydrate kinase [Haloactinomyces albus]|uniref:Sugar/nucleoside kinase (Ribokinase family) n=1 Tax=Haloactinomyces albus TaxID=1352928 RepID=A0AAE4CLY4_9ACTN|nr:PfkB family carbohydrate kinase [Haloactinomyces albus]MDR7302725.1 sugar/nucleoside kinase (ribokinase family) [Haloactinomyces albus]